MGKKAFEVVTEGSTDGWVDKRALHNFSTSADMLAMIRGTEKKLPGYGAGF
jgi:hypothetical protein